MVKIIPLTKEYLARASELADSIFPHEEILPSKAFEGSVDEDKFQDIVQKFYNDLVEIEYFIAADENDSVLGTSGIYSLDSDEEDSCWLGWYCVHPDYRGQGLGRLLMNYTVDEARKRGKKYLNLYTSTNPNEAEAQIVYERNGFYITDQKREKQGDYEIFYRRKNLG